MPNKTASRKECDQVSLRKFEMSFDFLKVGTFYPRSYQNFISTSFPTFTPLSNPITFSRAGQATKRSFESAHQPGYRSHAQPNELNPVGR